jgi:SpoVK/Ycf46/Vps4 family AAA+-type ATPase
LAIDEADAIMPQRGSRRSSDMADTIVPMFLGEMDGIDEIQTKENPIVILMTNRADTLDPAITRPGRINRHIKIDRPNELSAMDIMHIHIKDIPFKDNLMKESIVAIAVSDLFSKSRMIYRVNNEHNFTLGNCVNGAMLANIAEIAKMNALHRDMESKSRSGLILEDFRQAIQKVYLQQKGINHSYDLQDFAENVGLQPNNLQLDRCFGTN